MATPQASQNRVYLFRLQMLIIDGGTIVIRNFFDQRLSNVPLNALLTQEQRTINRLQTQKKITQKQYDLLYPHGNPPSTKHFDLTLFVCLLRNLKIFGLNPKYTWNAVPLANDTSIEAEICRLKEFRNEVAHICSTTGIQLSDFRFKWTELEQVLLRLNSLVPIPVPDLQQTIDDFKSCPLDPDAEKRIQKEIEAWTEVEKCLENQLQAVSKDVQSVKKDVQVLTRAVHEVKHDNQMVKKDVQLIQENVQKQVQRTSEHEELLTDTKHRVSGLEEQNTKKVAEDLKSQTEYEATDKVCDKRKMDLKDELIVFNKSRYSTIPLSPLFEENDTPITDFYITPEMISVQVENFSLDENEVKMNILSLEDIFYRGDKKCTEIYMTAEAGFGKTAFSKWLAVNWCQAHRADTCKMQHFSDRDLKALRRFDFLFLVSLRESCEDCSIDDMILNQIIKELARPSNYTIEYLEEILSNEKCLVVLDGLDEWSHPETECKKMQKLIPHRNARENCTILTTTRPWKLNVLGLKRSEIHRKIEITGLSEESVDKLKSKAITKVKGKSGNEVTDEIGRLNKQIRESEITDLQKVPLLLMYLICLWCDGFPLGRSTCEFYCCIIELFLRRTIMKYKGHIGIMKTAQQGIPNCFKAHESCTKYYRLLRTLGRLSFQTLFRKTNENTLIFDSSEAESYLDAEDLKFCLLSGLLSQNKVAMKLTSRKSKISFAHKTLQEFLAALYMYSEPNQTDMLNCVRMKCDSVKAILEMSKVFVFLNGFSLDMRTSDQISHILMPVIAADDITQRYRTTSRLHNHKQTVQPLKDIQDMFIACHGEKGKSEEKIANLRLQDIFIDRDCKLDKYASCLQKLVADNKENVSSLSIEIEGLPRLSKVFELFRLYEICGVEKIWYRGECNKGDIIRLVTGSVHSLKALSLTSCEWKGEGFLPNRDSWSHSLCETIQGMLNLEAINIDNFQISHDQLDEFMTYLAGRTSMKEIKLSNIRCIEGSECQGHSLDISSHASLTMLSLCNIPVSKLELDVSTLEHCKVGPLCESSSASPYLRFLPSASQLHTFWCSYLVSSEDIETMLDILPLLVHVKDIRLRNIDLGDRLLKISHDIDSINYIRLLSLTMSPTSLHGLVEAVEKCTHQVTVDLRGCIVKPENEFKKLRQYILSSDCFDVLFDNVNQFNDYAFEFKTVKANKATHHK